MSNTTIDICRKAVGGKLQYLLILALVAASILWAQGVIDERIAMTMNTVSAQVAATGAPASWAPPDSD